MVERIRSVPVCILKCLLSVKREMKKAGIQNVINRIITLLIVFQLDMIAASAAIMQMAGMI